MESKHIREFTYEDLKLYTNEFSQDNLIGKFQFGRVYRGKIPLNSIEMDEVQEVTVKIWEDPEIYEVCHPEDNEERLKEEVFLLDHPTLVFHPHLVKLIGYCSKGENLGVVYDLKPKDTVHNLLIKGDFRWFERIKVALQFVCLLEFFHSPYVIHRQYLIRNIDAAHIMLDEGFNVKLFDLSMISGGLFRDRRNADAGEIFGCYGYIDPAFFFDGGGHWSEATDVFAFGVVLLGLIAKRSFSIETKRREFNTPRLYQWARLEYNRKKSVMGFKLFKHSLADKSFKKDPEFDSSDGFKITKLAMQCVDRRPKNRPTMKQVVDCLLDLRVVRRHAQSLCVGDLIRGSDISEQNKPRGISKIMCI